LPVFAALGKIGWMLHGVQRGLQGCVFYGLLRQSNLETVVASMVDPRLGECDIFSLRRASAT
jgi:hypothetical protein